MYTHVKVGHWFASPLHVISSVDRYRNYLCKGKLQHLLLISSRNCPHLPADVATVQRDRFLCISQRAAAG
jgi:hypothetical protein